MINYAFLKLGYAAPILNLYYKMKQMVANMVFNPQKRIFCTMTGMTFEDYYVVLPIIMHSKSMILLCKAVVILLKRDKKCYTA